MRALTGILGPIAGIIGSIQANEVIKEITGIGDTLCGHILIIDALKLSFRKIKLKNKTLFGKSKFIAI